MQAHSVATNTLLMPNIPRLFFESQMTLEMLRAKFEEFGTIYAFVAMKGFRRFMIVYEDTECALKARDTLDKKTLAWTEHPSSTIEAGTVIEDVRILDAAPSEPQAQSMEIRLYYGQHNPINPDPAMLRLKVPHSEKNFLISPPGAPCEDWEQIKESPPNTAVLASDLTHAIAEMSDDDLDDLDNFTLDDDGKTNGSGVSGGSTSKPQPLLKIVPTRSEDHEGFEHLPMITVQDWDGQTGASPESRNNYRKMKVEPTARPPIHSS